MARKSSWSPEELRCELLMALSFFQARLNLQSPDAVVPLCLNTGAFACRNLWWLLCSVISERALLSGGNMDFHTAITSYFENSGDGWWAWGGRDCRGEDVAATYWRMCATVFHCPSLVLGIQAAEQRSRRPFLALSTGNTTSIYVSLCPLPSYVRCSNTETEKLGPWIFRKLWVAWLSDEFRWCGFVCWVPFLPAFLVVTVLAIVLFCLLNFFVASGCLFPLHSGFDPGNKWIAVEGGRNGQWKTPVWEKTENNQSKWGWGEEAGMGVNQALGIHSFPYSLPAPCKILSTLRPWGFMGSHLAAGTIPKFHAVVFSLSIVFYAR